ncbi:MAG: AMP-dependent synthetase/ligase, partial [Phycisphaeraceae bacterium]|nr:AMP-dependent synthetase/ligase [Phycisphaeraceae bacterium]
AVGREDLSAILYTSGTTGDPKGVMLSHDNMLFTIEAALACLRAEKGQTVLAWLPLSHIFGRVADHYLTVRLEAELALAGSIETLMEDLEAIRPHLFASVPRFFEKVWQNIQALPQAHHGPALRSVFGDRMQTLTSGGAPLPQHVAEGFFEAGFALHEGYGMTETTAIVSMQQRDPVVIGSVGQPLPGTEVRISDESEILTRGRHVMRGYWQDPQATEACLTDGWLHTGDLGRLDEEGHLYITGRKKDLLVTSGGKNVAPVVLEQCLVADPWIEQAVVLGDGRRFISALIVPAFEKWKTSGEAEGLGAGPEPEADGFIRNKQVLRFFQQRIDRRMAEVSQPERVRRILLLGRPLSQEAGEITTTLKVRRGHLGETFASQIDAIYAESPSPNS